MPTPDPALADGWRKSSRSGDGGGGNCVEVKFNGEAVLIRDSKYLRNPANSSSDQPIISIAADDWDTFLGEVTGRTLGHRSGLPRVEHRSSAVLLHSSNTTLVFTLPEWTAFTAGIEIGEFAA